MSSSIFLEILRIDGKKIRSLNSPDQDLSISRSLVTLLISFEPVCH